MNQIIVRAPNLSAEKTKSIIMKIIAELEGFQSIKFDAMKGNITIVGSMDPVVLVKKLRKKLQVDLVSLRAAKQENDRGENYQYRNYECYDTYRPIQYVPCPSYSAPLAQCAPVTYCINEQPPECVIV